MALVPLTYNLRSLRVRLGGTAMTTLSIAATVGVLSFLLCMQQGFASMLETGGRDDLAVFLRPGAATEGESAFPRERAAIVVKESPEIALDDDGAPLAAAEMFLAVSLEQESGGKTNVPIRGVQAATFAIHGDQLRVADGRRYTPGADELLVGKNLVGRIANCHVGEVLVLNLTPFRIVGVIEGRGSQNAEIWGDADRLQAALQVGEFNRVIGVLKEGVTAATVAARLENDARTPAKVQSEREYLAAQTGTLSGLLRFVGLFLGAIMGIGAAFTGTNAMLSSISSRSHEIGILLATGFRPWAIFASFLFESAVLGLLGGLLGCVLILPFSGLQFATTNFQTFTQVVFGFRFTPSVLLTAVTFAVALGLVGGALPALRAARMAPTRALRRG